MSIPGYDAWKTASPYDQPEWMEAQRDAAPDECEQCGADPDDCGCGEVDLDGEFDEDLVDDGMGDY